MRISLCCFIAFVLIMISGCGSGKPTTGTVAERAPGSEAGEKASIDAMKAMMKSSGSTASKSAEKPEAGKEETSKKK